MEHRRFRQRNVPNAYVPETILLTPERGTLSHVDMMKYLLLVFCCAVFLPRDVFAATNVQITKVSTLGSAAHEWVEITNTGDVAVSLTNWKFFESNVNHSLKLIQGSSTLSPHETAIITEDTPTFLKDFPNTTTTVFDSSWSALLDAGEELALKDASLILVDDATYPATNGFVLQRNPSQNVWCEISTTVAPGVANECPVLPPVQQNETTTSTIQTDQTTTTDSTTSTVQETTQTSNATSTDIISPPSSSTDVITNLQTNSVATTSTPQLFLSEIFPAPVSGEKEWIEMWNEGDAISADNGCVLADATTHIIATVPTIDAKSFATVVLDSAKLNNDGDTVTLTCNQTLLDSIVYGNETLPAPKTGDGIAREILPHGAWQNTHSPTPGLANTITIPITTSVSSNATSYKSASTRTYQKGRILINEIYPGSANDAWIELANPETHALSLSGFTVRSGTNLPIVLQGTIAANGHVVVAPLKSGLSGKLGVVFLVDPDGYTTDEVEWGDEDVTPLDNAPAQTTAHTSIARTFDTFTSWNALADFKETALPTPGLSNRIVPVSTDETSFHLNEIFPNPKGADEQNEFIEIKNTASSSVSTLGWHIAINQNQPKEIPEQIIAPHSLFVLRKTDLGNAIPNTGGTITLLSPLGKIMDTVAYTSAKEEESFAQDASTNWNWSTTATPGEENIFSQKVSTTVPTSKMASIAATLTNTVAVTFNTKATSTLKTKAKTIKVTAKKTTKTVAKKPATTSFIITGTVTAEPNILGSKTIIITNKQGNFLVHLGSIAANFQRGDVLRVTGKNTTKDTYTNVTAKNILKTGKDTATSTLVAIQDIRDTSAYSLVTVEGTVTDKKGRVLTLSDGDEISVQLPTNFSDTNTQTLDAKIRVTGILRLKTTGIKDIVMRDKNDVTILSVPPLPPQIHKPDANATPPISSTATVLTGTASGMLLMLAWSASAPWRKRLVENIAKLRTQHTG